MDAMYNRHAFILTISPSYDYASVSVSSRWILLTHLLPLKFSHLVIGSTEGASLGPSTAWLD
uniref:Uncharacterized protein n=1 Tax=Arundo donax TaxID=35708 RepID=A0A0A9EL82_ARUDO